MNGDMEQRLIALINNSTERVLDRIGTVEARLSTVETRIGIAIIVALQHFWR